MPAPGERRAAGRCARRRGPRRPARRRCRTAARHPRPGRRDRGRRACSAAPAARTQPRRPGPMRRLRQIGQRAGHIAWAPRVTNHSLASTSTSAWARWRLLASSRDRERRRSPRSRRPAPASSSGHRNTTPCSGRASRCAASTSTTAELFRISRVDPPRCTAGIEMRARAYLYDGSAARRELLGKAAPTPPSSRKHEPAARVEIDAPASAAAITASPPRRTSPPCSVSLSARWSAARVRAAQFERHAPRPPRRPHRRAASRSARKSRRRGAAGDASRGTTRRRRQDGARGIRPAHRHADVVARSVSASAHGSRPQLEAGVEQRRDAAARRPLARPLRRRASRGRARPRAPRPSTRCRGTSGRSAPPGRQALVVATPPATPWTRRAAAQRCRVRRSLRVRVAQRGRARVQPPGRGGIRQRRVCCAAEHLDLRDSSSAPGVAITCTVTDLRRAAAGLRGSTRSRSDYGVAAAALHGPPPAPARGSRSRGTA